SSDDETIDFIYGVINWKEMADQQTTDELLLQIDQALADIPEIAPRRPSSTPITDWADGPAAELTQPVEALTEPADVGGLPRPHFGFDDTPQPEIETGPFGDSESDVLDLDFEYDDADLGLSDLLALARDLAETARTSEDRSR